MKIKIIANDRGNPPGKLADAELHFESADGPLSGLKLIGFGVWERRGGAPQTYNVTFPARSYAVNGERRSFALLRPREDTRAQDTIRDAIIDAYAQYAELSETGSAPDLITPAPSLAERAAELKKADDANGTPTQAPGAPAVDAALKLIAERDSRITSLEPPKRKEPTPPAILF